MRVPKTSLAAWLSLFTLGVSASHSFWERVRVAESIRARHHDVQRLHVDTNSPPTREALFLNTNSSRFAVNGTTIPDVPFDIGESYAGLLSISPKATDERKLFFWFFPTIHPNASKIRDIVIWLNGGPGCSSLMGLLQEHGPFTWRPGTHEPVKNPWSWHRLAHVVYIEQPIGTGFSTGTPTAGSEEDLAAQFLGFWTNFVDTFKLHGFNVYISGESYAGQYCPYIASAMLNRNDTAYFNMSGLMMYDPLFADGYLQTIPVVDFLKYWSPLLAFNDTMKSYIGDQGDRCGLDAFMAKYLTFPPPGPFPPPEELPGQITGSCEMLWSDIVYIVSQLNPCFNIYHITDTCPMQWDVLGSPTTPSFGPSTSVPLDYFNRPEVKAAIHAPDVDWQECTWPVFATGDDSLPASWGTLPHVIDATKNVIIGHGELDFILVSNGTLLGIQNMTWGGKQGFQNKPTHSFFVPGNKASPGANLAGAGVMGNLVSERGLTFVAVTGAGHMVPQYAPGAALRQLEFLLGRVDCLDCEKPFTIQE